jgi:hypothetical protein
MKYLVFVLVLLAGNVSAQSLIVWNVTGLDDSNVREDRPLAVERLELDISIGERYISANGAVILEGETVLPITGTCAFLQGDLITCELAVRQLTYSILMSNNLSGTITILSVNGTTLASGALFLAP